MKRRYSYVLLCAALTLCLTGCHWAILDPQGPIALSEKQLLIDATLLMLIVVVPVIIMTFAFAWRYRASNKKATYRPDDAHNNIVEAFCWGIPCIIIIVLAIMTWRSTHNLDPYRPLDVPGKPITIHVFSLDWKWLFVYPQEQIATVNFVQIPVNVPIQFLVTSDAPMNSLEIPQLAGQIYAMGGMQTKLHLMATATGDYYGLSTNYSGGGFSDMNFIIRVSTQAQYDQWIKAVKKMPHHLTVAAYNQLTLPTEKDPVQYFSGVPDHLFNNVMMKYMMPDSEMYSADDQVEHIKLGNQHV